MGNKNERVINISIKHKHLPGVPGTQFREIVYGSDSNLKAHQRGRLFQAGKKLSYLLVKIEPPAEDVHRVENSPVSSRIIGRIYGIGTERLQHRNVEKKCR